MTVQHGIGYASDFLGGWLLGGLPGRWSVKFLVVTLVVVGTVLLASCAEPLAADPCAKPANPKGCTPLTCAHPVCYGG